ncbi:MAG: serine acetyltransferase [Treponema sp.]|nr:serine acetyltransferase [Treponema sp.]MBQ1972091.1 serine acetyltransferase [Treponema sp.]MBQ5631493.1 serine acetyltransferase [Treponema sp.]MBQ5646114.1 serine acetyltransferase [Treponema sp.]MBQ5848079.1 serine acetyltransferase [Treponema sp.]
MNIDMLIDGILDSYDRYGGINRSEAENFPNRQNVITVLQDLQCLIFPGFRVEEDISPTNIRYITGTRVNNIIATLTKEIQKALVYTVSTQNGNTNNIENSHCFKLAEHTSLALLEELPEIKRKITLDVEAVFKGDPAAKSKEEIILSYPGLEAILIYRIANFLYTNGVPIIPRIMSEYIHGKTGIDINPGAKIGESFFIDHGTGIVIGETTVIGNNVKIYQGVTLGALSVKKELKNKKRHPTIEDDVTIYAGATILGGETTIGRGSTIGGNTWVTHSIPAGTVLTQNK